MIVKDRTLIRTLGLFGAFSVLAVLYILFRYDGDKIIALGSLGGIIGTFVAALRSLDKSTENGIVQKQTAQVVRDSAQIVQETVHAVEQSVVDLNIKADDTHSLVNGQSKEWKQGVEKIASLEQELAVVKAIAIGIAEGRSRQLKEDADIRKESSHE
jgi:hypothetical protein